jgi:hypothetical protein
MTDIVRAISRTYDWTQNVPCDTGKNLTPFMIVPNMQRFLVPLRQITAKICPIASK